VFFACIIKSPVKLNNQFNNPFYTLEEAETKDRCKQEAVESRGFKYHIVWSDSDYNQQLQLIKEMIS
jgi:hypothetical protein